MDAESKGIVSQIIKYLKKLYFCSTISIINEKKQIYNMDWKDSLSALKGTLPQGDAEPVAEAPVVEEKVNAQNLIVSFEKKGRGGKAATIISGFTCDLESVREIADTLKKKLATGGSYREEEILIQGDKRDAAVECLKKMGHKAKRGN